MKKTTRFFPFDQLKQTRAETHFSWFIITHSVYAPRCPVLAFYPFVVCSSYGRGNNSPWPVITHFCSPGIWTDVSWIYEFIDLLPNWRHRLRREEVTKQHNRLRGKPINNIKSKLLSSDVWWGSESRLQNFTSTVELGLGLMRLLVAFMSSFVMQARRISR